MEMKPPVIRRIQRYVYEGKEYGRPPHPFAVGENGHLVEGERVNELRVCELLLDLHSAIEQILERDIRLETER